MSDTDKSELDVRRIANRIRDADTLTEAESILQHFLDVSSRESYKQGLMIGALESQTLITQQCNQARIDENEMWRQNIMNRGLHQGLFVELHEFTERKTQLQAQATETEE